MKRYLLLFPLSLVLLVGCTTQGVGEEAIPETSFTITREVPQPGVEVDVVESVTILNATTIVANVGGSSSCPPVIDKVTVDEEQKMVQLFVKTYPDRGCTADFGLLPQRVTAIGVNFDFNNYQFRKCSGETCSELPIAIVD